MHGQAPDLSLTLRARQFCDRLCASRVPHVRRAPGAIPGPRMRRMGEATPTAARRAVALGLIAAAVAALIYAGTAPEREAPVAESVEPAPVPETAAGPEPTAPAAATEAPSFDLVRVEPDGSAAVAGTAAPEARVTIYADGAPARRGRGGRRRQLRRDAEGRALDGAAGADPQRGRARGRDRGVRGGGDAAAARTRRAAPGRRAGRRAAKRPAAGAEAGPAEAEPPPTASTEPAVEGAAPEVAATAIVRADEVEVPPPAGDPAAPRRVALASISYADTGEVRLAGTGTAGAELRAYVDGAFAEAATVAEDGRWRMELGDVAGGLYRLRIDQIGADGQVASRVETPFQRDYPQAPPPPRPGASGAGGRARCRRARSASPCSPATTSGLWRGRTMVRACSTPRSSPRTAS